MYGEVYIRPWELRRMTFREVMLAIDGLREKDLYNQSITRRSTLIVASALGGKKIAQSIDKLWPMGDKKEDWLKKAKALLKKASEYDDQKKVVKMMNHGK